MIDPTEVIKNQYKVMMKFEKPLNKEKFDCLKNCFYNQKDFSIWGNPIILGPLKMHIYGVNRTSWSQIMLEITDKYVMAIFPPEEDLENIKSAISKAIGVKLEEVKK